MGTSAPTDPFPVHHLHTLYRSTLYEVELNRNIITEYHKKESKLLQNLRSTLLRECNVDSYLYQTTPAFWTALSFLSAIAKFA
jgi:hypothetical protein